MKRKPQPPRSKPYSEVEVVRLVWLAIFISVFSFLFYNRQGAVLFYGDAVAHINIARRIFDSKTPGLLQLGTVWLPLPHLLILPFIISKPMWQSGAGGSIYSMIAFVLGALGIFRLVRSVFKDETSKDFESASRIGAWAAAIIYGANPNLIYMQATAMGEALYLALFIWSLVYFAEWLAHSPKGMTKCGLCLAAACLTRYDGWFLAGALVVSAVTLSLARHAATTGVLTQRRTILRFILVAAVSPVFWLAYNAAIYRNPLEFANGPYSAKAIEAKTATVNPAKGNLYAAGSYFLKAAELNLAESPWVGRLWLGLALGGTIAACFKMRLRVLLLLWTPLPFYALSVAYGSVPIFVPTWWPFSIYNARYGLQLLPAFAVFASLGICFLIQFLLKVCPFSIPLQRRPELAMVLMILIIVGSSYAPVWRADPICYREADLNMKGRVALDRQVSDWIKSLPMNSTLLMYLGEHVGALQQAGIPLRQTINEGNHRVWRQPSDPEGLWERALADPENYADFAIGFEGDPVWKAARNRLLTALVEIHTTGQPSAVIFQARKPAAAVAKPR